jgi:hypothetical protein
VLGEPAGDLVQQQHARRGGEGARELEPLAVEQREAARRPVRLVGEAALLEQLDATRIDLALAPAAAERRRHHQVLEHGHGVERLRDLKGAADAHAAAPLRRQPRDIGSREQHSPGVRHHGSARHAEQRGLAGPVRADDAERLALGEREIDRLRHDHRAEPLGDFLEGENGGHTHATTVSCRPRESGGPYSRDRS